MTWWMWLIIALVIAGLFYSFIMAVAAVFNWMHAGTADFWEVAGLRERKEDTD